MADFALASHCRSETPSANVCNSTLALNKRIERESTPRLSLQRQGNATHGIRHEETGQRHNRLFILDYYFATFERRSQ